MLASTETDTFAQNSAQCMIINDKVNYVDEESQLFLNRFDLEIGSLASLDLFQGRSTSWPAAFF